MTKLSVNINKIALLRNSRKGNFPDLYQFAKDCEEFGAQGITVHPRPDERHIRYADIPILKAQTTTEFNIEGNPTSSFMQLVLENRPDQCTLVPDSPDALTSDQGWNTIEQASFLSEIIEELKSNGIRVSLFVDPELKMVEGAAKVGADRIELYTGNYAKYYNGPNDETNKHAEAASLAKKLSLGVNAGHDLNLANLQNYRLAIPHLKEVSIGHALVADSLYFGIQNTIQMYRQKLKS